MYGCRFRGSESSEIRHSDAGLQQSNCAVLAKKKPAGFYFSNPHVASQISAAPEGSCFFFFARRANLQLQINSSCLQHPSAVSPFALPLLQFPQHRIASPRFPASTSPFPLLSLPLSISARFVRSPRQQIQGKVFEPANSSSYVTADQKKKKHRLKKNAVQQVAVNVHLRTSHITTPPPLKRPQTCTVLFICVICFAIVRVCICIFMLELWRRISVRRRTSHGMSGERQQRWENQG